ncbi:MAG: hybrid sensor histidine kinase/response regulator [Myxococcaceae bacterium]|nr:hybrid sensor histidine kinase/response regulator [Myxococcaceae bacterium]
MRFSVHALLCLFGLLLSLSRVSPARADVPLDVARELCGSPLGKRVSVLEDPSQKLTLRDVRAPGHARKFRRSERDVLSQGFSESAYWLRVEVKNSASAPRPWLLEVGFPHLDHVTLYVPEQEGDYSARETGDKLPFAQRDLSYRNFVFMLEEPAQSARVYYLRVATGGVCSVPLSAWSLEQFAQHQHLDWAVLCVFYGVILMMAGYNLSLYGFTREPEYLGFALFVLAMGAFQMTVVGHTFQFLLPNHNDVAQAAVPLSIAITMLAIALLGRQQLRASERAVREHRLMDWMVRGSLLTVLVAAFGPFRFSIRFVPVCSATIALSSFVVLWRVMRNEGPRARLYVWGWSAMLVGGIIGVAQIRGLLPKSFFTEWSAQIGASLQFVLVSAGMAAKLNWLRSALFDANQQLARKVQALEHAVTRADLATARAERAMRVKDEFMATMSHELRTPLNTIINVPQGLVEDFPLRKVAVCSECRTHFELEQDELVLAETRCLECHARATLQVAELAVYTGQPARTTRYLETIERSGKHLLQVVNGILRTERLELADGELSYSVVEVFPLVRDVVDELRDWAERSGVRLHVLPPTQEVELAVDSLRLRQVLLNLVGNAIKFSGGSGTVTVSIQHDELGCRLSVQDQGIGIAADKLEAVFDSYRQVHDSDTQQYGGTGLGLSIARDLVRKHGGELWVESELGRGATFSFRIPRQPARKSA